MKVTNTSKALQGVNTKSGRTFIRPGETKDVEFDEAGMKQAKRLDFLKLGGGKAEKEVQNTSTLEAKHRGGGSYSIMRGDEEVAEKLTKEDAEAFNSLSDADKAAYVEKAKG